MKAEKKTESARRYLIEYPVFSDGVGDVSLMNAFSEKLASSLAEKCRGSDKTRYRLTYSVRQNGEETVVTYLFTSSVGREALRSEKLEVTWKNGYIKRFERS